MEEKEECKQEHTDRREAENDTIGHTFMDANMNQHTDFGKGFFVSAGMGKT